MIVALEDAVGRHWRNKSYGNPENNFSCSLQEIILHILIRDFVLVCQYAGFDHEYIRMKAKQFFNERKKYEKRYAQYVMAMDLFECHLNKQERTMGRL